MQQMQQLQHAQQQQLQQQQQQQQFQHQQMMPNQQQQTFQPQQIQQIPQNPQQNQQMQQQMQQSMQESHIQGIPQQPQLQQQQAPAQGQQFLEAEARDGVRFAWNVLPTSRLEAARMAIPVSLLYTPLHPLQTPSSLHYSPVYCKSPQCAAILSPYCRVDFLSKLWLCPFCLARNFLPPHYAEISQENRPAEIIPQFTTIEYVLDAPAAVNTLPSSPLSSPKAPAFVFLVDTCLIEEEFKAVKTCLIQSLLLMPEKSLVSLITFGRNVHLHELAFEECPKSFVFRGDKTLTTAQLAHALGIKGAANSSSSPSSSAPSFPSSAVAVASRFLMPVSDCEYNLTQIVDGLSKDCWTYKSSERSLRASGTALSLAISLLELSMKNENARIFTFLGGPCTFGGGAVCSLSLSEPIRSHHDLSKGHAPLFKSATKFYHDLAVKAASHGHTIDLFACSLDQVGVAEMRVTVDLTGGYLVLDDSFTRGVFQGSFKRIFARDQPHATAPDHAASAPGDLAMAFAAEIQVLTSRELKVSGAIGHCSSLERKGPSVAENEVGVGQTCAWLLGGLDPAATLALYFEMSNVNPVATAASNSASSAGNPSDLQCYIQLCTKYRHSSGRTHLRVTTVARKCADGATAEGLHYLRCGFDQEAAAVLMTRLAIHKCLNEFTFDVLRWLDRSLIRLVSKFATYTKNEPQTFKLSADLSYYPQFMFHLRRSQFLQVFNSSPDESAFFRCVFQRETCSSSLIMLQPTLMAYTLDGPAEPVVLDVSACASNRILVLDTFFHVVIWYGDTIAKWQQDQLDQRPEYAYLAQFFKSPKQDAQALMDHRFPYPRFIECVEKGSQSRFLMAKLNPSITQANESQGQQGEPPVFTEDVSMKVFMQHLRRLAVSE